MSRADAVILLILFLTAPIGTAKAAGFDCRTTTDSFATAICNSPDILKLDDTLNEKYRTILASLSPKGSDILRENQAHWLEVTRRQCLGESSQNIEKCVESFYGLELKEYERVKKFYPYLILTKHTYEEIEDDSSSPNGKRSIYGAVPFVEGGDRKTRNDINEFISGTCGNTDDSETYGCEITFLNENFISMASSYGYFPTESRMASYHSRFLLLRLQDFLPVKETDLFLPDGRWKDIMMHACAVALGFTDDFKSRLSQSPGDRRTTLPEQFLSIVNAKIVASFALNIGTFQFTDAGIGISCTDEVSQVFGAVGAEVSWADLKPFLRQGVLSP